MNTCTAPDTDAPRRARWDLLIYLPMVLLATRCDAPAVEVGASTQHEQAACKFQLSAILGEVSAEISDSAQAAVIERGLASFSGPDAIFCRREILRASIIPFERLGRSDRLIGICEELLDPGMYLLPEPAAHVRMTLAKACLDLRLPRAFDEAKAAFLFYRENNIRSDRMLDATALLATTYELTNETEECKSMLETALQEAETEQDIRWTCDLLDRLGAIATREGRAADGVRYHERSLDKLDRFFRKGAVLDTMVRHMSIKAGRTGSTAVAGADMASELLTSTHYLNMRHRSLKLSGDALLAAGNRTSAIERYQQAIDLNTNAFIPGLIPPFAELGQAHLAAGDAAGAVSIGLSARERALRDRDLDRLLSSSRLLHRAYKSSGETGKALSMLELANAYDDTLNNLGFRMGLLKQQMSYTARADSALMQLKVNDRERQMNDERSKARRNRNATFAVGGAGILMLAASGLWYRSDRRRRLERFERDAAVLETQALRSQMNHISSSTR